MMQFWHYKLKTNEPYKNQKDKVGGYGAILSHLTFNIPETIPKSSGGNESSDSSTSRAALETQSTAKKSMMQLSR